jgi:hypothetical protein
MTKRRSSRSSATRSRRASKTVARHTSATRTTKRPPANMRTRVVARRGSVTITEVAELDELRREIERSAARRATMRWNADPDDVQRSVAQLVLTLVEFVRKLLERQAIRRMEAGALNTEQTEAIGQALMKLEETIRTIASRFGITTDQLNLDLGPVGKLM